MGLALARDRGGERSRPAHEQLGAVARAGVHGIPAALVVLAPARGHGGLGTVFGLAVGVVHEPVAAAPLS